MLLYKTFKRQKVIKYTLNIFFKPTIWPMFFHVVRYISLFMCFLLEECVCVVFSQRKPEKMMKHKSRCHHPPSYETTDSHSVQIRRELGLRRAGNWPRSGRNRPNQHPGDVCCAKRSKSKVRTFAIDSQEIRSFFNLFGK